MGEADPLRLGDQAEQGAVTVEAPGSTELDDLETELVVTVQQLIGDLAGRRLVGQLERFGAEPLNADHRDEAVGQNAAHRGIGLEMFELHALLLFFRHFQRTAFAPWRSPAAAMAKVFGLSMLGGTRLPLAAVGGPVSELVRRSFAKLLAHLQLYELQNDKLLRQAKLGEGGSHVDGQT